MQHNILITSAGKRVALVRYFKETISRYFPDAKVFTTDLNPQMAPAGYVSDHCFAVPRVTAPEYPAILKQICLENNVGVVIATIDTELLLLASLKAEFAAAGIHVIVSDSDFIATCRDKRNTGAFFETLGVRIPRPIDKRNPTFPLFAKPYDGSLSADLHYIKSPEDLTEEVLSNPKLMFMEYIDKQLYKEYTVDMYFGRDNSLKMAVPRERIEIRAGEINKGRTHKGFLLEYLRQRLEHIDGCVGTICVQVFYNETTHDVVGIEINPRFGGGYPLSYAAGANFPQFIIQEYLLNQPIQYSDQWTDQKLMLRFDDAVFI